MKRRNLENGGYIGVRVYGSGNTVSIEFNNGRSKYITWVDLTRDEWMQIIKDTHEQLAALQAAKGAGDE